jgi:RNAse (barnase) inhibitor barstar
MAKVQLDGQRMCDWSSFHTESQEKFGFPDFYGRNMDAWVDCLSGLRDADGMSSIALAPDETLHIEVLHSDIFRSKAPHILVVVEDCLDALNERYIENGQNPALQLDMR